MIFNQVYFYYIYDSPRKIEIDPPGYNKICFWSCVGFVITPPGWPHVASAAAVRSRIPRSECRTERRVTVINVCRPVGDGPRHAREQCATNCAADRNLALVRSRDFAKTLRRRCLYSCTTITTQTVEA